MHISLAAAFHEFVRLWGVFSNVLDATSTRSDLELIDRVTESEGQRTNLEGRIPMSKARFAGFEIADILMLTAGVLVVAAIVYAI